MRKSLITAIFIAGSPVAADEVVIAALGDSLTQGFGLPQKDGLVPQLQGWLEAKGADVRLINAGVSGDTTAGGLARVGWTLSDDVDAMIVALGGNDLLRGLAPEEARNNISGILAAAAEADVDVLLVGMQAPGNFGADYKAKFDAIYPELAKQYGALYLPSFFVGLSKDDDLPDLADLQPFLQADGIHPNAAGVVRIVDGVGPAVLELIEQTKG